MDTEPIRKGVDAVRAYLLEVGDRVSIMGRPAKVINIENGYIYIQLESTPKRSESELYRISENSREWVKILK